MEAAGVAGPDLDRRGPSHGPDPDQLTWVLVGLGHDERDLITPLPVC